MAAISNIQFGNRKLILGEKSDQLEQARRMLVALVDQYESQRNGAGHQR